MELLNILTQYKEIRDRLKAGEYLGAWRATLPVQESMIQLGESIGFKAGPDDDATKAEIVECAKECVSLLKKAPKEGIEAFDATPAAGSFDWRTALMKILAALFEAWKPNS